MEGTTVIENTGAPSTEVDETNVEGKAAVAAHSEDQKPDFQLIDSLHDAATQGKISEDLKKYGKELDQILTPSGNTILHIYIICHQTETAEFVRKVLGMCPNLLLKANGKGETPLHFAARYGHDDIVKELLEECQKPCYKDQQNGVETKRLMLEKTNEAKDTALHEAVRYNHTDVINRLIDEDPEVPYDANGSGETPLYLAAERGYEDVVRKILDKCKSAADHGPMGRTALHAAVIRRDEEMTTLLLDKRPSLTSKSDQQGWVPLHCAAYLGYINILKKLLYTYKSAAYKVNNEGKTALHLAAGQGKVIMMQELISSCPGCCELVDRRGRNVLHFASLSENDEAINLVSNNPLLGNLINEKDEKGNTPLLQLAASGSYVPSFLDHPAVDKLAFNHQNQNAADMIVLDNDLILDLHDSFLRCLNVIKTKRYRRIIVPSDEAGKEEEKHKDKGNRESSKSHDLKGKDRSDDIIANIKEARDAHLVAATLIATLTFTAGFALPGGYIGKNDPHEGAAVLITSTAFQAFVIFNTVALILSSSAVFIHLSIALNKDKTQLFSLFKLDLTLTIYAMLAMVFAFVTGTYAVLYPIKKLAISACVIGCMFVLLFVYVPTADEHLNGMIKKRHPKTFYFED